MFFNDSCPYSCHVWTQNKTRAVKTTHVYSKLIASIAFKSCMYMLFDLLERRVRDMMQQNACDTIPAVGT